MIFCSSARFAGSSSTARINGRARAALIAMDRVLEVAISSASCPPRQAGPVEDRDAPAVQPQTAPTLLLAEHPVDSRPRAAGEIGQLLLAERDDRRVAVAEDLGSFHQPAQDPH